MRIGAEVKAIHRLAALILVVLGLTIGAQAAPPARENRVLEQRAEGTFDVKLVPDGPSGAAVGGMTIDKVFHGDLDGTSDGRMLAVRTAVDGSAGYVAMERVTGTLAGRHGSFALQHSGTMDRGTPSLSVTVVPDSGTDALAGIKGAMEIRIEGGKHFYTLRYTLPT